MKIIDYFDDEIPGWALSYLVNGDASGITEEDKAEADEWMNTKTARLLKNCPGSTVTLIESPDAGEGSFTHYPAFGQACDCFNYVLAACVDNDDPRPGLALPWEEEEDPEEDPEEAADDDQEHTPHPYPVALQTPEQWLAARAGTLAPQFAMTRQWKEGRTNHTSQCQDAIDARLPVNAEAFERYTKAPTDPDWRLKNTAGYIRTGTAYHYTETPTT